MSFTYSIGVRVEERALAFPDGECVSGEHFTFSLSAALSKRPASIGSDLKGNVSATLISIAF
jgi:hypothetical protein